MVFKAIFETGHANQTAKVLSVSAPKISRCLNHMRGIFDDELFYRRQYGLKPTPLAETLYPSICRALSTLLGLSQGTPLGQNPDGPCLTLAVHSHLLIPLSQRIRQQQRAGQLGPVHLQLWRDDTAERLHRGDLDLGIALEAPNFDDLEAQPLGEVASVCVVAREDHPLWSLPQPLTLELLSQYPFLYYIGQGFNERMDPLEAYCRREGLTLPRVDGVTDREEWVAHLLTMDSFAFAGPAACCGPLAQLPGLQCQVLPDEQVARLHGAMVAPRYYLVERRAAYRRYDDAVRAQVLGWLDGVLDSPK
ncbi:LysR family transcriptional regulator [Ferrimonas balearica]|uniref:LysR family transcriptional regulator n=1 Tax=Ferrimonas balearica TaxID=44012 RepID=UPI0021BD2388|nr:LysR family transcriptional regulator [Ferrimonas balearica]